MKGATWTDWALCFLLMLLVHLLRLVLWWGFEDLWAGEDPRERYKRGVW